MCGFIAQLVEQRTGNAEVTGSNPVEALIFFSGFFFPVALIGKFTAMIILHFHLKVLLLASYTNSAVYPRLLPITKSDFAFLSSFLFFYK